MAKSKKDKTYFSILAVGVVLIVVALTTKNNQNTNPIVTDNEAVQEQSDTMTNNMTANVLEGTLRYSDDSSRGNLKLVSNTSDIYIRTLRDFSSLVGLEVLVRINGTLDKFELLDVEPKVIKDGYIRQQ